MATSVRDRDQAARSRAPWAATAYRWGLLVFLLAVAVQIFLAGLGVFSYGDGDRAGGDHAFSAHQGSLLDSLGDDSAAFGGLHALDGLLIAVSAGWQYVLVRRR